MLGSEDGHASGAVTTQQITANRSELAEASDALPMTARAGNRSEFNMGAPIGRQSSGRRREFRRPSTKGVLLSLLSVSPAAMAACIPLQGSTACSAFQSASVSTDSYLVGLLYVGNACFIRWRCDHAVAAQPFLGVL